MYQNISSGKKSQIEAQDQNQNLMRMDLANDEVSSIEDANEDGSDYGLEDDEDEADDEEDNEEMEDFSGAGMIASSLT